MILARQEALKITPLISNLDAYDAYLELLNIEETYCHSKLVDADDKELPRLIGKLQLIKEFKEVRQRLKDSIENG